MYDCFNIFYKSDEYNCKSEIVNLMSSIDKICDEFRRRNQLIDLINEMKTLTKSSDVILKDR